MAQSPVRTGRVREYSTESCAHWIVSEDGTESYVQRQSWQGQSYMGKDRVTENCELLHPSI